MKTEDYKDFHLNCQAGIQVHNPIAVMWVDDMIDHGYEYKLVSKTFNKGWLWMLLAGIGMFCLAVALPLTLIYFIEAVGELSVICSSYPAAMLILLGIEFLRDEKFWNKKYEHVKIEK